IRQSHNICMKNQVSFNKFSFNLYQQKQSMLNLLKAGKDIMFVAKEYVKTIPLGKKILLAVINTMPDFIIRKIRKIYHIYKEK
ncbi:MAG: hypothetical protein VB048_11550, partial [Bacteroidaceae bacterium]|nr:hypothetical protein [Bacteroidaceae bacterium]